jgi:hypothetical protein
LEAPAFLRREGPSKDVQLLYPPERLRPKEGFKRLLKEYQSWMSHHRDRNLTHFLSASRITDSSEEHVWEIRKSLRGLAHGESTEGEDETLRWHLILHLAKEWEESKQEAEQILRRLRSADVLLKGLTEEDEVLDRALKDLPGFEGDTYLEEKSIIQIMDAWFALFNDSLRGDEVFITLSNVIWDLIVGYREELDGGGDQGLEMDFKIPDLSHRSLRELSRIRGDYGDDERIRNLGNAVLTPATVEPVEEDALRQLFGEAEKAYPWDSASGTLEVHMVYLPQLSGEPGGDRRDVLSRFSNKKIIFLETFPLDG